MKRKKKTNNGKKVRRNHEAERQPFIAHVRELRQRLMVVALSVVGFTAFGFLHVDTLITILLNPSHTQEFIYTSPGGGFDFTFRICLYFGLAASVPVFIYNVLRYFEPLVIWVSKRYMMYVFFWSCALTAMGIAFAYFISLPAALTFLLNEFTTERISALLSVQDYLSFVIIYLVGSALLFQIPLVLLFFNSVKPLKPRKLISYQRYVILISFVLAAIITPTSDVINLLIMAVPIIIMYQVGVTLIWVSNFRNRPTKFDILRQQDAKAQAKRLAAMSKAERMKPVPFNEAKPKPPLKPAPTSPAKRAASTPKTRPTPASRTARPNYATASRRPQPRSRYI